MICHDSIEVLLNTENKIISYSSRKKEDTSDTQGWARSHDLASPPAVPVPAVLRSAAPHTMQTDCHLLTLGLRTQQQLGHGDTHSRCLPSDPLSLQTLKFVGPLCWKELYCCSCLFIVLLPWRHHSLGQGYWTEPGSPSKVVSSTSQAV